jgi:hypothetical protein
MSLQGSHARLSLLGGIFSTLYTSILVEIRTARWSCDEWLQHNLQIRVFIESPTSLPTLSTPPCHIPAIGTSAPLATAASTCKWQRNRPVRYAKSDLSRNSLSNIIRTAKASEATALPHSASSAGRCMWKWRERKMQGMNRCQPWAMREWELS